MLENHHAEQPAAHGTWDSRYAGPDRIWSGNPNQALVELVGDLPAGTALDVGCGEGADAVWLATQGWQVVGLDPSRIALDRGRAAAAQAHVQVEWRHGLLEDEETAHYDLVCVSYPALELASQPMALLKNRVASGGHLVVLMHAHIDRERALAHGFDPDTLLQHHDVVEGLGADWVIEVNEQRERHVAEGAGTEHTHDLVIRARRA